MELMVCITASTNPVDTQTRHWSHWRDIACFVVASRRSALHSASLPLPW